MPGEGVDQDAAPENLAGHAVGRRRGRRRSRRARRDGASPCRPIGFGRSGRASAAAGVTAAGLAEVASAAGTGRGARGQPRRGEERRRSPLAAAPGLGRRARIQRAVGRDQQRADLGLRGIVNHRDLAVGGDAIEQAFAVAAGVDRAVVADRDAEQMFLRQSRAGATRSPLASRFQSWPVGPVAAKRLPDDVGGEVPDVLHARVGPRGGMLRIGQVDDLPRRPGAGEDVTLRRRRRPTRACVSLASKATSQRSPSSRKTFPSSPVAA